jgi:hypothetical protein
MKIIFGTKKVTRSKENYFTQNVQTLIKGNNFFPKNHQWSLKRPKWWNKFLVQKGHVTFQGQGHVISRSLLFTLVAYIRMHLCAKFDAKRTISLRFIQMAPKRDRQIDSQSNSYSSQYRQNVIFKDVLRQKLIWRAFVGVPQLTPNSTPPPLPPALGTTPHANR